jgi:hypothetical protein
MFASHLAGTAAVLAATITLAPLKPAIAASGDGFEQALMVAAAEQRLTGTDRAVDPSADPDAAMITKADRSFSELPFGADRNDAVDLLQLQLREIVEDDCDINGTCDWLIASAPHVRHRFDENGLVTSKHIIVDDIGNGEIRALGIGRERISERVIDNIIAFLPCVEITCLPVGEAGEGEGRSSCGGNIGDANFKLIFADTDILAEVHLYRYSGV